MPRDVQKNERIGWCAYGHGETKATEIIKKELDVTMALTGITSIAQHIGDSSVRYGIGLSRDDADDAATRGHFVHVYVDRATNRSVALPRSSSACWRR